MTQKEKNPLLARARLLLAVMLTIMVIYTGRLIYLQFIKSEEYRLLSEENFLEQRRIQPLRGRILARDGTVLAENRIAVDLMYWGGEVVHEDRLHYLLNVTEGFTSPDTSDPSERLYGKVVAWNIDDSLVPAIEELVAGQANVYLRKRVERTYPSGLAPHVIGYTTEADPERFPGYALGDLVGLKGIEASYQEVLFGAPGTELVEVNNRGVVLDRHQLLAPRAGQDITLTIDLDLQQASEQILADALTYVNPDRIRRGRPLETNLRGAVIAMNPQNGEILAMASYPDYDPNVFTHRPSSTEAIEALLQDDVGLPLMNRAISEYPPASTFKLVSSIALLEGGFISPQTRYACSGNYNFLGIVMRNWAGYYRGTYTSAEAIADSCNTFYFQAAANTPDANTGWSPFARALTDKAFELGYGNPVGIGLDEEKSGRIPTDDYSRDVRGYAWRPGDTLNIAIGQGDLLATPVQVSYLAATIATSGKQARPHLVQQLGDRPADVPMQTVSGRYWSAVQDGMRLMMTQYGGRSTLGPGVFPVATAGKTGTAQNSGIDHAWFTGYGPLDNPELVVTVFIQHGGSSTAVAIPIARDIMAHYWQVNQADDAVASR
ncbi:MAG: penicillin-binding transpeptidase domain-containing protein [Deinococcota bacterium]